MASGQDSGSIPLPLTTPAGRAALLKKYKEGLCAEVLPFWMAHGADRQMGGWWTAVGKDGEVVDDDKSVWFQGRATWMFATCFNFMVRCITQRVVGFFPFHCHRPTGTPRKELSG